MKKTVYFLLCLLLALSGCAGQQQKAEDALLHYNLGAGSLRDGSGREVTYQIQGTLGIPAEKNCPVVVLVHGSHPIQTASEAHYDAGFDYLTQALSEQGNLVISLNVAMNYSFENGEPNGNERTRQILNQQLTLLKQAVDGDEDVFGRDLTGLGDFRKIVLMGHSRGGMDVLECAQSLPEGSQLIGAVCVAPSTYKAWEAAFPNVPVGIILPQMDGDVISLDGSDIYEDLLADAQHTAGAELIYLKNANHGAFNTQLNQPDLNHTDADVAMLLPPEQQRSFLTSYLIDFVQRVTTTGQSVFASAAPLESSVYGCDVLLRVHSGAEQQLWSAEDDASLPCQGGAIATQEIASYQPNKSTVSSFKLPGGSSLEHYVLQRIVWSGAASSATIPLAVAAAGSRFLDLDLALDSTDPQNQNGQSMTLTLTDADGNTAQFPVGSDAAAMLWQEGTLDEKTGWDGLPAQEYSTFTPLVTLRLDLSQAKGVDLTRLASLTLCFDTRSGSLMLRSVSVGA